MFETGIRSKINCKYQLGYLLNFIDNWNKKLFCVCVTSFGSVNYAKSYYKRSLSLPKHQQICRWPSCRRRTVRPPSRPSANWPRQTTGFLSLTHRAPSGNGLPSSATSTRSQPRTQRTCPGWGPSSSSSNKGEALPPASPSLPHLTDCEHLEDSEKLLTLQINELIWFQVINWTSQTL